MDPVRRYPERDRDDHAGHARDDNDPAYFYAVAFRKGCTRFHVSVIGSGIGGIESYAAGTPLRNAATSRARPSTPGHHAWPVPGTTTTRAVGL